MQNKKKIIWGKIDQKITDFKINQATNLEKKLLINSILDSPFKNTLKGKHSITQYSFYPINF